MTTVKTMTATQTTAMLSAKIAAKLGPKPIKCNWCKQHVTKPCQNALEFTKCGKRVDKPDDGA